MQRKMWLIVILALSTGCSFLEDDVPYVGLVQVEDCQEGEESRTWYPDEDGDLFGARDATEDQIKVACTQPEGFVLDNRDCDDNDSATNPDATELCNDGGKDLNCDGDPSEGATDTSRWYQDADRDGFGNPDLFELACTPPDGHVDNSDDCEDRPEFEVDGVTYRGQDIKPGVDEECDGIDNNCNPADDRISFVRFQDADEDGFGNDNEAIEVCEEEDGYIERGGDCDDMEPLSHPGRDEVCGDNIDNNCSMLIDGEDPEVIGGEDFYPDRDSDGWADADAQPVRACGEYSDPEEPEVMWLRENRAHDCDDTNEDIHPDAQEICGDGINQNCDPDNADDQQGSLWFIDSDDDGFGNPVGDPIRSCLEPDGPEDDYAPNALDCNDDNELINPDAEEICNGIDDDCDSVADTVPVWWADLDRDGFGDPDNLREACEQPSGFVEPNPDRPDCEDLAPEINPGELEVCDNIDNDCDGDVDDDDDVVNSPPSWHPDRDEDGYGEAETVPIEGCEPPAPPEDEPDLIYADNDDDCNDNEALINPGQAEDCDTVFDDNCDPDDDEEGQEWYLDRDGDQFGDDEVTQRSCTQPEGYVANGDDCNDGDRNIFPGAEEICDGIDNDCDRDNEPPQPLWFRDVDGDGFGDANDVRQQCDQPEGFVNNGDDCEDDPDLNGFEINPNADEVCDLENIDHDCNPNTDEPPNTFYRDNDGDEFGNPDLSVQSCDDEQPGFVQNNEDCQDDNEFIHPDAEEICDNIDNNCNQLVDDEDNVPNPTVWYADVDEDGHGNPDGPTIEMCGTPDGFADNADDCEDRVVFEFEGQEFRGENINPNALEVCDLIDNNCNDRIDEGFLENAQTFCLDFDQDGYGDPQQPRIACTQPQGYAPNCDDCNDEVSNIRPFAVEVCFDGIDQDCIEGNDSTGSRWYVNRDGDAYGIEEGSFLSCERQSGHVTRGGDCDDTRDFIHPGAQEVCDAFDNDCDEETPALIEQDFYRDSDEDGFGDPNVTREACIAPDGFVDNADDCVDDDPRVHPDSYEVRIVGIGDDAELLFEDGCGDGIDGNCNDLIDGDDLECQDTDGDTIPDGIDGIMILDTDDDLTAETVCLRLDYTMPEEPWMGANAVRQANQFGGFATIDSVNNTDLYGEFEPDCPTGVGINFQEEDLAQGNYKIRWISAIGLDGESPVDNNNCNDWQIANLQGVCDLTADPACFFNFGNDCGERRIGFTVDLDWDGTTLRAAQ